MSICQSPWRESAERFPLTRSSSYRFKSNPRFKAGQIRNALHLRKICIIKENVPFSCSVFEPSKSASKTFVDMSFKKFVFQIMCLRISRRSIYHKTISKNIFSLHREILLRISYGSEYWCGFSLIIYYQ